MPEIPGVTQAYLGILPATELLKLLQDDSGDMIGGLFYDNVRDWLDFNEINQEIKKTLESDAKKLFVLMNNGITIIARHLQPTGDRMYVEDFSIVNGCQTSHVLFDQREAIDDSVMVPVRLIGTSDEGIINNIIRATNRQTEVKEEQFFALQEFSKSLEQFFQAFPDPNKIYYERRTHQYDRIAIERTRIITPANMIRAFAGMFLGDAHRTTKNYKALKAKVGHEIFVKGDRMEPYYTAAFALYKLEYFFRTGRLEAKLKPARFHILLAARLLFDPAALPKMNSNEMERRCRPLMETLWESAKTDDLFLRAAAVVEVVANGNFDRDAIRTEPFTQKVVLLASSSQGTKDA